MSPYSGYVVRSTKHDKRLRQEVENGFANKSANPSPLIVYAILLVCTFRSDFLQNTKNISIKYRNFIRFLPTFRLQQAISCQHFILGAFMLSLDVTLKITSKNA